LSAKVLAFMPIVSTTRVSPYGDGVHNREPLLFTSVGCEIKSKDASLIHGPL
jgi:hypothetical protein